jgi:hypothetical protein
MAPGDTVVRFGFLMGAMDPAYGPRSLLEDLKAGYGLVVEHMPVEGLLVGAFLDLSYQHTRQWEPQTAEEEKAGKPLDRHLFGGAAWLAIGPRIAYEFLDDVIRPFLGLQLGYAMLFAPETPFTSGFTANPEAGVTFRVDSSGTLLTLAIGYSYALLASEDGISHVHGIPFSLTFGKAF